MAAFLVIEEFAETNYVVLKHKPLKKPSCEGLQLFKILDNAPPSLLQGLALEKDHRLLSTPRPWHSFF
jgi:hypothetical protein